MKINDESKVVRDSEQSKDDFIRLFLANQAQIYAYILTMVHNWNDADDIFQESSSIMFRKFEQFNIGSNFVAWGISIARFEVLKYREKSNRKSLFEGQLAEDIAGTSMKDEFDGDEQLQVLRECLSKLGESDKQMIQMRYSQQENIQNIAKYFKVTVRGLYYRLGRIHYSLLQCVKRGEFKRAEHE